MWPICGNPDIFLLNQPFAPSPLARAAAEWTRSIMEPRWYHCIEPAVRRRGAWLCQLPDRHIEGDVMYVHASPLDTISEYIEELDVADIGFGPSEKIQEIFSLITRLCFVGHTHRAGIITGDYKYHKALELPDLRFEIPDGVKLVCNIGAVGQPRDGDPRASYVIWDGKTIQYRRVVYFIERVVEKIRLNPNLHIKLAERLRAGV